MTDCNIKFICLTDVEEKFNLSEFAIIHYIIQACIMLKIRVFGGGICSIEKIDQFENESELEYVYRSCISEKFSVKDQIILYKKISEDDKFIHYNIMAFNGSKIEDIDKLLRAYRLKIFI